MEERGGGRRGRVRGRVIACGSRATASVRSLLELEREREKLGEERTEHKVSAFLSEEAVAARLVSGTGVAAVHAARVSNAVRFCDSQGLEKKPGPEEKRSPLNGYMAAPLTPLPKGLFP